MDAYYGGYLWHAYVSPLPEIFGHLLTYFSTTAAQQHAWENEGKKGEVQGSGFLVLYLGYLAACS